MKTITMTARELRDQIDAAIAANPAAADAPVYAAQAYTTRAIRSFEVGPGGPIVGVAIHLETETIAEAPCECGGVLSYLPDQPRALETSNMICDECGNPRPVEL